MHKTILLVMNFIFFHIPLHLCQIHFAFRDNLNRIVIDKLNQKKNTEKIELKLLCENLENRWHEKLEKMKTKLQQNKGEKEIGDKIKLEPGETYVDQGMRAMSPINGICVPSQRKRESGTKKRHLKKSTATTTTTSGNESVVNVTKAAFETCEDEFTGESGVDKLEISQPSLKSTPKKKGGTSGGIQRKSTTHTKKITKSNTKNRKKDNDKKQQQSTTRKKGEEKKKSASSQSQFKGCVRRSRRVKTTHSGQDVPLNRIQQPCVYINPNLMKVKLETDYRPRKRESNASVSSRNLNVSLASSSSSPSLKIDACSSGLEESNKKNEFRQFKCNYRLCKYAAKTKTHLRLHTNTHSKKKKYKCKQCKYRTSQEQDMKRHIKIHKKKKGYLCEQCSFASHQVHGLTVHLRTHTGKKPYKCQFEFCSYAGITSTHLKSHHKHRHLNKNSGTEKNINNSLECKQRNCGFIAADFKSLATHYYGHGLPQVLICKQPL